MPKNRKPKGGRSSRNFEPRYAKKTPFHDRHGYRPGGDAPARSRHAGPAESPEARETREGRETRERRDASVDRRPGSRSPGHRGYRPADAAAPAPKRRWTAQERAGRDEARAIRNRAEPGRLDASRRRTDRDRDEQARPLRDDRVRHGRDDRREAASRRDREDRRRSETRASRDDWTRTPAGAARATPQQDVVHARLEAQAVPAAEVEGMTFADLGLGSNITEILANMGAQTPFPIQAASIPAVLSGRDVLARGRTGSGKTIAFGAPRVESILQSQKGRRREFGRAPRAIVLAPTRELALQIDRTVQPIARSVGLFTTQIYGGVPQARQVGALKKGVDIVIGTPGRIEDLIEQGKLDLSDVRIAVLDEADHMCELGFVEPVQRILRHAGRGLPEGGRSQKLLFSATLDREVAALVDEFLAEPAVFEVAGETQESGTIDHRVLVIEHRDKAEILTSLVDRDGKTLVFARTRAYAEMLAEAFDDAGIPAVSLHGDLNQAKRTRNLARLTSGAVQVLVATDVAARGIHVDDIDLVVQADAPDEYKTYLHRAGRTGRAGRAGRVVTLITRQRRRRMAELLDRAEIDAPFEDARPDGGRAHLLTDTRGPGVSVGASPLSDGTTFIGQNRRSDPTEVI